MQYLGLTVSKYQLTIADIGYLNTHGIGVKELSDKNKEFLIYKIGSKDLKPYEVERFKNNILRIPNEKFYEKINDDFGFHSS